VGQGGSDVVDLAPPSRWVSVHVQRGGARELLIYQVPARAVFPDVHPPAPWHGIDLYWMSCSERQ
jgi:hypothetical protein